MQCNGLQSLELYEQTVIVCQIPQWILQVPVRPSEGQMQRDWDRHLYQLPLNCVKANIWCHRLQHQWVIFSHQLATLLQYIVKKFDCLLAFCVLRFCWKDCTTAYCVMAKQRTVLYWLCFCRLLQRGMHWRCSRRMYWVPPWSAIEWAVWLESIWIVLQVGSSLHSVHCESKTGHFSLSYFKNSFTVADIN